MCPCPYYHHHIHSNTDSINMENEKINKIFLNVYQNHIAVFYFKSLFGIDFEIKVRNYLLIVGYETRIQMFKNYLNKIILYTLMMIHLK